jgi:protease-4
MGCDGGEDPSKPKKLVAETLIELDLSSDLEERSHPLFGAGRPSHFDGLLRLQKLVKDPLARGLFVRLGSFGGRHADVDDWAQMFDAFRAQKKPVHCHFDELDNGGYALAAHCDRLSMTPAGLLNLVGMGAQLVHGRALLDQIGLQAEIMQVGKYKGAAEPFTRDSPSEELKTSIEGLLTDFDGAFRGHLAQRAQLAGVDPQSLCNQGPYSADRASAAKLIDDIGYDDEARAQAKRASGARLLQRTLQPSEQQSLSLRDVVRAFGGPREREYKGRAHLAVGFLTGEISDGDGRGLDGAASDPFVKMLRRWGDDTDVRAVLLRIESPGGSALASDRMWHAVQRVARRKPVIVSLGDMAASGGYYVASAGTVVIAAKGTIVGSIGVVGGKVVVAGLANRLGVHVTTLSRSERAAWLSPFAPFSPAERGALEGMLQGTYRLFLERVSIGRKRSIEQLLPAAEGRVMGGERAHQLGLVDEVGGFMRAFQLATQRGKLPDSAPLEVWPDEGDPLSVLTSMVGTVSTNAQQRSWAGELEAAMPRELRSAGGLLRGLVRTPERALAVLPFALYVH